MTRVLLILLILSQAVAWGRLGLGVSVHCSACHAEVEPVSCCEEEKDAPARCPCTPSHDCQCCFSEVPLFEAEIPKILPLSNLMACLPEPPNGPLQLVLPALPSEFLVSSDLHLLAQRAQPRARLASWLL